MAVYPGGSVEIRHRSELAGDSVPPHSAQRVCEARHRARRVARPGVRLWREAMLSQAERPVEDKALAAEDAEDPADRVLGRWFTCIPRVAADGGVRAPIHARFGPGTEPTEAQVDELHAWHRRRGRSVGEAQGGRGKGQLQIVDRGGGGGGALEVLERFRIFSRFDRLEVYKLSRFLGRLTCQQRPDKRKRASQQPPPLVHFLLQRRRRWRPRPRQRCRESKSDARCLSGTIARPAAFDGREVRFDLLARSPRRPADGFWGRRLAGFG